MTESTPTEHVLARLDFDDLPPENRVRMYGLDYARLSLIEGGELFVTRIGWARLPALMPERWFMDKKYAKQGFRLPGGTGNVFQLPVPVETKPNLRLVVKFARSGQDVPLHVATTFPDDIPSEVIQGARWNSPFEEFGLIEDLRRGRFRDPSLRIRTKRPLAIYSPPSEYREWQLGRSSNLWKQMDQALQHAQEMTTGEKVHLHASRLYIMLFEWVEGENAEDACLKGWITEEEMQDLTRRVVHELSRKGFQVLDNKPRHFILRPIDEGLVIRRNGELVYTLIDFELLKRTDEYEKWLRQQKA